MCSLKSVRLGLDVAHLIARFVLTTTGRLCRGAPSPHVLSPFRLLRPHLASASSLLAPMLLAQASFSRNSASLRPTMSSMHVDVHLASARHFALVPLVQAHHWHGPRLASAFSSIFAWLWLRLKACFLRFNSSGRRPLFGCPRSVVPCSGLPSVFSSRCRLRSACVGACFDLSY